MPTGRSAVTLADSKAKCQQESSAEHSNHAAQIQTGIYANGCARTVLGVVAAVDETVDAVREPERQAVKGAEAIAPVDVGVAFAHRSELIEILLLNKSAEEDYPFDDDDFSRSRYTERLDRAYIWGLSFLDELDLCEYSV